MKIAVDEARTGINAGHGGPFGCVIVRNGEIVGQGHNEVVKRKDPTCHGEVMAIPMPVRLSVPMTSRAVNSTPPLNPVPCAEVRYSGRI